MGWFISAVTLCDSLESFYFYTFTAGKTLSINHFSFLTTGCDRYGWFSRHENGYRKRISILLTFIKTVNGGDKTMN